MSDETTSAYQMRILVLGSAAGGGSPQWNCRCDVCARVRERAPGTTPRTQTSVAISADGARWVLLDASPDLRAQLAAREALWPRRGARHSPLQAVVLTGAETDQIAGLLHLRERHAFALYGARTTFERLDASPIFDVLRRDLVPRRSVEHGQAFDVRDARGEPLGLTFEPFSVPGKIPLYDELRDPTSAVRATGVGLRIKTTAGSATLSYVPCCAAITPELQEELAGSDVLLFDGTLWRDDELSQCGVGDRTGRAMGHVSMSGPHGSLEALDDLEVRRKVFIHINNTNPVLLPDSAPRRSIELRHWEIAYDGMELSL